MSQNDEIIKRKKMITKKAVVTYEILHRELNSDKSYRGNANMFSIP